MHNKKQGEFEAVSERQVFKDYNAEKNRHKSSDKNKTKQFKPKKYLILVLKVVLCI